MACGMALLSPANPSLEVPWKHTQSYASWVIPNTVIDN